MRRRTKQETAAGVMPPELEHKPSTREQIETWLSTEEVLPPDWWAFGVGMWRQVSAHRRWSDARRAWRVEHDPSFWWYWDRPHRGPLLHRCAPAGLTPPPRSQREAMAPPG